MNDKNDSLPLKPSPFYLGIRLLWVLLLLDTLYALIFVLYVVVNSPTSLAKEFLFLLWLAHVVRFIASVILILRIVDRYLFTRYRIDGHHLVADTGILEEDQKLYELKQIKSMKLGQGWWGRRFHYGNISLTFGARGYNETVEILAVGNPHKFVRIFEKYLNV